jgi:hypothetical protein
MFQAETCGHISNLPYLDIAILPGEQNDDRQTAYDDARQNEYCSANDPVQGHDAGTVVLAGFAAFRTLQALEHSRQAVLVVHVL